MCWCKLPPILSLYLLTSGIILIVNSLYIIGPAYVKIKSIQLCSNFSSPQISMQTNITDYNETAQLISGYFNIPLIIDHAFTITLRGMQFEDDVWIPDKTYIDHKSLCSVVDNYLWEMNAKHGKLLRSNTVCPIVGGNYAIEDFSPDFDAIELPVEMFGHVKFLLEIEKEEEIYLCQEWEFENTLYPTMI